MTDQRAFVPHSTTSALVKGHTLRFEGRVRNYYGEGNGEGQGRCSCGEKSPMLPTTAARKRWHREHKAAVIAGRREATK